MVVSAMFGLLVMEHVAFEGAPYASVPIAESAAIRQLSVALGAAL